MAIARKISHRIGPFVLTALLFSLLAGCASPAATPPIATLPVDLVALQQQVDTQATQIAALQAQSSLAKLAASQAVQIAALETQVARAQVTPTRLPNPTHTPFPKPTDTPTALPTTPQPINGMLPRVTGLTVDGNTKGSASAKVTITEYVDYF